jgi:hypothetical protein
VHCRGEQIRENDGIWTYAGNLEVSWC